VRPHRDAAPAHPEATDHDRPTGQQDVGRADDPVDGALAGAEAVIEEMLGVGVIDGDDRVAKLLVVAMDLSLITPVVVSSVPPMMVSIRSVRSEWMVETRSAPSSIVIVGSMSRTALRWA
jgi:hypothetical protein